MKEKVLTRYLLTWVDAQGESQYRLVTHLGWHKDKPVKVGATTISTPLLAERLDIVMREVDKQVAQARERLSIHIETSFSIAKAHSSFECAMANGHMAIREEFLLGWYTNSLYHRLSRHFAELDMDSDKVKDFVFNFSATEHAILNNW